jgi:hypothetical protein
MECPNRSAGPFHSIPGSEYLQPPFLSNSKRKTKKYFKVGQLSRNPCVIRAKYITLIKVDKKNRGYNEYWY